MYVSAEEGQTQPELQSEPPAEARSCESPVAEFFGGASVLVTGGTGFLGKVLVEKLLRTCPRLRSVYLLVRTKKGRAPHQRLDQLFSQQVFSQLRPSVLKKVVAVAGDVGLADLGLSAADRAELCRHVSVVFHAAATVRFDEQLELAAAINVRGTHEVMRLARDMPNLKAVVHVSTAYSQCRERLVEERVYEAPLAPSQLLHVADMADGDGDEKAPDNKCDADISGDALPLGYPNTYTLTKAVAEQLVRDEGFGLPVAIVRPSMGAGGRLDRQRVRPHGRVCGGHAGAAARDAVRQAHQRPHRAVRPGRQLRHRRRLGRRHQQVARQQGAEGVQPGVERRAAALGELHGALPALRQEVAPDGGRVELLPVPDHQRAAGLLLQVRRAHGAGGPRRRRTLPHHRKTQDGGRVPEDPPPPGRDELLLHARLVVRQPALQGAVVAPLPRGPPALPFRHEGLRLGHVLLPIRARRAPLHPEGGHGERQRGYATLAQAEAHRLGSTGGGHGSPPVAVLASAGGAVLAVTSRHCCYFVRLLRAAVDETTRWRRATDTWSYHTMVKETDCREGILW